MSMSEVINNTQDDGSLGAENLSCNAIRKKSVKKTKIVRRKVKKKRKTKSKFGFGSQSSRFASGSIYKTEKNSTPGPKVYTRLHGRCATFCVLFCWVKMWYIHIFLHLLIFFSGGTQEVDRLQNCGWQRSTKRHQNPILWSWFPLESNVKFRRWCWSWAGGLDPKCRQGCKDHAAW